MAQWYHFYHTEDDAEILVGLYDRWLGQVGFGPTQAERVLLHTEMMELAHERRFAIAQASRDMSDFEAEHSRRITEAIDHLERNFISRSYEDCISTESYGRHRRKRSDANTWGFDRFQDDAVIEMMAWSNQEAPVGAQSAHFDESTTTATPSPPDWLRLRSQSTKTPTHIPPPSVNVEAEIDVDDAGSEGFIEEQYRAALTDLAFVNLPSKREWRPSSCPKRVKEIRVRKRAKLEHHSMQYEDDIELPNTSHMSLEVMLN